MPRNCFGDLGGVKNCWGYKLKLVRNQQDKNDTLLKNVRVFSYKELQKATNNFSPNSKLARYGFPSFYKGTLEDGSVVAIKVLLNANTKQGLDFVAFIDKMSIIRHRNVAGIIGYCLEGDHLIIVHEFVGGYGLDQLLFDRDIKHNQSHLSWHTRASICIGIARGLEYLHEGASHPVVHRNIKASNILLDDHLYPKIINYEIAQLCDDDVSHYSGNIARTLGYRVPNMVTIGTEEVDVHAFGILLLEIISGRRVMKSSLVDLAWELQETGKVLDIVDPTLSDFPEDEVKRYIHVALSCVQSSSNLRPSMSGALLMLLGGDDFSRKVLRNPKHDVQTSIYDELSDKVDVTIPQSDAFSPVHMSTRKQDLVKEIPFRKAPKQLPTESVSTTARGFEIEIESDLETHSTSELMEISHDLETELYESIEDNNFAAPSLSGPSDTTAVPELVGPSISSRMHNPSSLSTDIHVHGESVEATKQAQMSLTEKQLQMSQDLEDELQLREPPLSKFLFGQTSGKIDVRTSSSAEIVSLVHSEAADRVPYQAETNEIEKVLSPPEVDVKRPIECTLEKILEALKDHKRILLYGRGGSGKTTVLKNLFHHPVVKKLFDNVLFMTIPRFAYREFVRDEFVRLLSLNLENDSSLEDDIFSLIREALQRRKFLVILDDVWESINLHEIGIPDPSPENSCWVVLAARFLNVYHGIDSEIKMEVLSDAEAWALFCCQVGSIIESPTIEPYARAISEECHKSPVIISAIGSALRGENSVEEWKAALSNIQFREYSRADEQYSCRHCIQYCYDRLKARDVKTGFLYCSLFQYQQEQGIDISVLVECFINEGLVGGTTVAAYKRGYDIVGYLINASLLEANDNGIMVKMHNVMRDSALQILLSDYQVLAGLPILEKDKDQSFQGSHWETMSNILNFMTRVGAHLKNSPSIEEWEQATMVVLMDNEFSTLPRKPRCSTLVALLLQRNSSLRMIPASFFDNMPNLKLLNLSETRIKSLPNSFSSLSSLQILLMRDCERLLSLPPSIGLLKSLEVIDLQGTEITHLPDCVGELASLKQLRVSFYGSMNHHEYKNLPTKLVSDGILSRLGLRELGMFVYPGDRRWTLSASGITEEISCLKLSVLHFHFPKIEDLEKFVHDSQSWINRDVTAFKLIVGPDFKRIASSVSNDTELLYNESQRCLRYVNGESIPNAVVEVLTQATSFYLDHHLRILYLSQFGIHCFNGLKICILRDCPELVGLLDNVKHERECFSSLEYLSINYLWNLNGIWGSNVGMGSFARLRYLSICACPKLSYALTSSMVAVLSNLEELIIGDCVSLKYVVIEDAPGGAEMRKSEEVSAPELPELKVLKLHYLPEICGIWTARWPPVQCISFYNCPGLKNLRMKGTDGVHIKEIAADMAWWNSLEWDDPVLPRRLHTLVTQIHIDDL